MNALGSRIAALIRRDGPIGLDRYWNIALFDPVDGYYTSRQAIGAAGDFVTAPEISQMFGELIAAWLIAAWRELGRPSPFALVEIGPGRGTLMADILRTARRLDTAFLGAARLHLVETSDRLAAEQAARLAPFDLPIRQVRRLAEIAPLPLLLVANELFDAVAIQQFRFDGICWRERLVGLLPDGGFAFEDGPPLARPIPHLPSGPIAAGSIFEHSPLREGLAADIGAALYARGGAALFLDYGHAEGACGDTLQALERHRFADVLAEPGARDITSHVDFQRLGTALGAGGAVVSPIVSQGMFLHALGLAERAAILGRDADVARRTEIVDDVRRLAGDADGEMGALFKVIAAASAALSLPPFAATR